MIFDFFRKKAINNDIIKEPETVTATPSGSGSMEIEDAFSIRGRGTVVTGKVHGTIRMNDTVLITTGDGRKIKTIIRGIEAFRRTLDVAQDGDNCGLLLDNVARDEVERGDKIEVV